jgi:hypothetical protein
MGLQNIRIGIGKISIIIKRRAMPTRKQSRSLL